MHNFVLGGNVSVVQRLLQVPEILNDMERKNKKGWTGLQKAIEKGHTDVAEAIKAIKQLNHQGNYLIPRRHEKQHFVFQSSKRQKSNLLTISYYN